MPLRTLAMLATLGIVLSANVVDADEPSIDLDRLRQAKAALEERMEARREAGWVPKSEEEQMLTRLRASKRMWEHKQHRAAQRAAFEQAKGEVYLELAKHFAFVSRRYYYYQSAVFQNPITGEIGVVVGPRRHVGLDPLAAALARRWGDMAARSNGIAAAQEYRASTYYASRIANTEARVAALEAAISGPKLMAAQGE